MVGWAQFLDHSIMLDSILTISLLSQGMWPSAHMETSNPVPEVQIDSEGQIPSALEKCEKIILQQILLST